MRLRLSVLSALLLASASAQADPGRVQFSAAQSSFTTLGADGMLPLLGDNHQFFYGDLMGDYSTDDTYLMSPGLGYRSMVNNQIWGGYVFDDYERTSLGENFWVLSPGVEWMNASWDAHVNGYFPIQSRQQNGTTDWADNYGNYQYGDPYGNSFDDAYLTPYAVIGNGVDTEVGYSFDQGGHLRSRVFLGGYYYHPQDAYDVDNISGATAGFTKAVTKNFTVSLLNSYDNINRYTFGINLAVTLGGDSNEYSGNVEDRMLDPVERHVGIIDTGAGTYDQQSYQVTGFGTEHDNNVGYVSADASIDGVGTYEDPAPLTQDSLDSFYEQFSDGALIYVQGGDSQVYDVNSTTAGTNNGLLLYDGQDIYGRSADYKAPAASDEQPIISVDGATVDNGFIINSGENTLEDLTITASSTTGNTVGINVVNDSTNTTVNVTDTNVTGFNTGLYAENSGTGNLTLNTTSSSFNNNTNSGDGNDGAYGFYATNTSSGSLNINVVDSQFNGNTSTGDGNGGANGMYVYSDGAQLNMNITNSSFNGNMASGDSNGSVSGMFVNATKLNMNVTNSTFNNNSNSGTSNYATGLAIFGNAGTVNITNSQFNSNTVSGDNNGGVGGFFVGKNISSDSITVNVTESQFNDNAVSGDNNGGAFGFLASNASTEMTINITRSQFNGNSADGDNGQGAFGLVAGNTADATGALTVSATESQFNGNTASGADVSAYGFYAKNNSTDASGALSVTSLAGSTMSNNGTYGLYAVGTPSASTTVNASDANIFDNPTNVGNGGNVTITE